MIVVADNIALRSLYTVRRSRPSDTTALAPLLDRRSGRRWSRGWCWGRGDNWGDNRGRGWRGDWGADGLPRRGTVSESGRQGPRLDIDTAEVPVFGTLSVGASLAVRKAKNTKMPVSAVGRSRRAEGTSSLDKSVASGGMPENDAIRREVDLIYKESVISALISLEGGFSYKQSCARHR